MNIDGIGTGFKLANFAKDGTLPSKVGTNALNNSLFDEDNGYPIGSCFTGSTKQVSATNFYPDDWSPYSPLWVSTDGYPSFLGNFFLTNTPNFDNTSHFGQFTDSPSDHFINVNYSGGRVLKMYGAGASFLTQNRDADRTYPDPPITSCTSSGKTVTSSTNFFDADLWTRHEWSQGVSIPNGATSATFGAFIRCPSNDLFRELNFGGIYIWEDTASSPPTDVSIDAIAVKNNSHSLNLASGSIASGQGHYQWSGLSDTKSGDTYPQRWNDTCNIRSITYKDSEDFPNFTEVSKTVSIRATGSGRRMGFSMFFAENHTYMTTVPNDILSGAIDFYSPFLIFS
jgi:hypothetical protein